MHPRQIKSTTPPAKNQLRAAINANLASIREMNKAAKPVDDPAVKAKLQKKEKKRQAFEERKAMEKLIRRKKAALADSEEGHSRVISKFIISKEDNTLRAIFAQNFPKPKQQPNYKRTYAPAKKCTASYLQEAMNYID